MASIPDIQTEYQACWPARYAAELDKDDNCSSNWFMQQVYLLIKDIAWHFGLPVRPSRLAQKIVKDLTNIVIYPAPLVSKVFHKDVKARHQHLIENEGGIDVPLRTPDGYKINNLLFPGNEKKAIIYLGGRVSYFQVESCTDYTRDIQKGVGDVSLFLINPRGVGLSGGKSSVDGIELDIYTAFKYLVDRQGIHPNDIVIYGYSLGGATGMLGAELIQEEYPDAEINIVCDRSFANLEEEIVEGIHYYLSHLPRLANCLCYVARKLLYIANTQIDVEKAVSSLRGKKCVIYHHNDEGTPYHASLYFKYKQKYRAADQPSLKYPIHCIKLSTNEVEGESPHTRLFRPWERFEVINEIRRMLHLPAADPLLIHRVKELGSEYTLPSFVRSHPACLSILSLEKMRQALFSNPEVNGEEVQTLVDVIHNATAQYPEFSQLLLSHENRLKQLNQFPENASARQLQAFYVRALQRTQVDLICQEIEKTVACPVIDQDKLSWLIRKLETTKMHPEDRLREDVFNYAHFLFGEIHNYSKQYVISPNQASVFEFGRLAAYGFHPVSILALRSAVNSLKNELILKRITY